MIACLDWQPPNVQAHVCLIYLQLRWSCVSCCTAVGGNDRFAEFEKLQEASVFAGEGHI